MPIFYSFCGFSTLEVGMEFSEREEIVHLTQSVRLTHPTHVTGSLEINLFSFLRHKENLGDLVTTLNFLNVKFEIPRRQDIYKL